MLVHTCKPQCKPLSPALAIGSDLTGQSKFIAGLKAIEQGLDSTVAHLGGGADFKDWGQGMGWGGLGNWFPTCNSVHRDPVH